MNLKRVVREEIENEFKWIDDTPSSIRGIDLMGYQFTHPHGESSHDNSIVSDSLSSEVFLITKVSQKNHVSGFLSDVRLVKRMSVEYVWEEGNNAPRLSHWLSTSMGLNKRGFHKSNMFLDTFISRIYGGDYILYDQDGNYINPELLVDMGHNGGYEEDLNESDFDWVEDIQPTFLEKLKVATETNPNINVIFIPHYLKGSDLYPITRVSITDKRGKTYFTSEEIHWDISKEDFLSKIGDGFQMCRMDSGDAKDFKELYSVVDSLIISEGVNDDFKWLQDTGNSVRLTVDDLEFYYGEKFVSVKKGKIGFNPPLYHLEKIYEKDNFEWVKEGTKVRWYDPEEEYRDLERVWIIKDYYGDNTFPLKVPAYKPVVIDEDLPINIESEDGYSQAEVFLREVEPIQPKNTNSDVRVVDNDEVNVCWKPPSNVGSPDVCTTYSKTDVIHYFNNSDWVFLSMTDLNESNDFKWIEDYGI